MASYSSMAAIKKAIQKKAKAAMRDAQKKMWKKTRQEIESFYYQGSPTIYGRTGTLGNSPQITSLQDSGDSLEYEIYLDQSVSYEVPNEAFTSRGFPSCFTTPEIFDAAESGSFGVKGKPGFWARSEAEFQNILDSSMAQHFN